MMREDDIAMAFPFRNTTAQEQQALSFERLRRFIGEYVYPYSPYYRRLMRDIGLTPDDIRTPDDFRRIPITTKDDLVNNLDEFTLSPRFPGRPCVYDTEEIAPDNLARYRASAGYDVARDLFRERTHEERVYAEFLKEFQPIHFQLSGGTTGRSAMSGYTSRDVQEQFRRSSAWWYSLSGRIGPEDKWINLLPAAPHLGIYATMILPLLAGQPNFNTFGGKVTATERQVEMVAADRFTVLVAIPSYLIHWLRTARAMQEAGAIGPITGFHTAYSVGEPLTPAYRAILKQLFAEIGSADVAILNGMSSTELRSAGFYECAEGSELHLDPENFYLEAIDPETREPVSEGAPAVFVWSHIDWRGTVILRYWSGDLAGGGIRWGHCGHCGLTIPRLIGPLARAAKDFTKIRGARVELMDLIDAVRGSTGVQTFQIVLRKSDANDPFSRDMVEVHVASNGVRSSTEIASEVQAAVTGRTEIRADDIIFEEAAAIEARLFAKKLKAEWIVDLRPQP